MSEPAIRKVCVIGAGVMGSGIAAQVANAGVPVLLLDIVKPGAADRSAIAAGAIERLLKTDPAPLMHKDNARRITPGNIEDDLHRLADVDWIVEAVLEDLAVKQALYRRLAGKRRPGSILSSNTSTIRLERLVEAIDAGLSVEEADAVMGRPIGVPKTGIFGLLDLVGLDLQPHVDASLAAALPADDPYQKIRRDFPLLHKLIAEGSTGRKGKGGFYRLDRRGGGRVKQALDLRTGTYGDAERPRLDSVDAAKAGLRALVEHPDRGGRYAWRVLSATLAYAAGLVPEVAD